MALRIQTQISGDVFILLCDGRIVFGDEGAVLRERIGNMLPGTPKIVVNLSGVDYIDSGGLGILVGLLVSARNRGGELKLVSPRKRVKDLLRRTVAKACGKAFFYKATNTRICQVSPTRRSGLFIFLLTLPSPRHTIPPT